MIGDFLDVDQACAFLHCKKAYLYQLIHKKQIPHFKPNRGRVLFDAKELEQYIRKSRVATYDELGERATELINKRGAK